jgi:O-antigen/teichoic acid export membrane protein
VQVVAGGSWAATGQVAILLASLLATPFVVRQLGPAEYGLLALVNSAIAFFAFAELGMATASTRFGADAFARGDRMLEARVTWTATAIAAVPTLTVVVALWSLAPTLVASALRLPAELQREGAIALRLAAVTFAFRVLAACVNTPQVVRLRYGLSTLITAGITVGHIVVAPVILWLGGGVAEAVLASAVAWALGFTLHSILSAHFLPQLRRPAIRGELVAPLLAFGMNMFLTTIALVPLLYGERFLLARMTSVSDLAFYSVAATLAGLLALAPRTLSNPLLPALTRQWALGGRDAVTLLYGRAVRGLMATLVPLGLLLMGSARPFLSVWAGPLYAERSTPLLFLLLSGVVAEGLAMPPTFLLLAVGKARSVARVYIAQLVPYAGASLVLIHQMGAEGAAAAWSLRAIASAAAFYAVARRHSGVTVAVPARARRPMLAAALPVAIAAVAVITARSAIWQALAVVGAVAASLLATRHLLTPPERAWMVGLARRTRQVVAR